MKLETHLTQTLKQTQKLSMKQQLSLKALSMNAQELVEMIQEEANTNPLLEIDEFSADSNTLDYDLAAEMSKASTTLIDELLMQLHTCRHVENPLLCEFIIYSLDNNGYLTLSVEEIAQLCDCTPEVVEDALYQVQSFEPCGVAARSLKECLIIQCAEMDTALKPYLMMCVDQYLDLIADNKLPEIAQRCDTSLDTIKSCVTLIKTCNPTPGAAYAPAAALSIPDIFISIDETDTLNVTVKNYTQQLKINHAYDQSSNEELKIYVKEYTKRIQELIAMLDKRQNTLFTIVSAIVSIQAGWFLHQADLLPMTLNDIAVLCNLHESTVSRAVQGKLLEFNQRYIPLKFFFNAKLESGQSSMAIQQKLKKLIEGENKKKPYSDAELSALMKQEDIQISRRTIAKYRDQLAIPSASKRKIY
ncbi:RNA polymerase factor sigma-54 [Dielma fastidiosa]|uniref:RNA polymerase factor sigma-54 n=1 Tax=Dielma fastidiosa TaxID=1034346 RepID=UPI000EDCF705|nr:RNA polymerase factor sigma-54 [Dielma fastidiosa]HAH93469.1 RNA polymerase sigma-54 factor [Dielma fastidiosa]